MQSANLIPAYRRAAKARGRCVRAWVVVVSVFGLTAVGVGVSFRAMWGGSEPRLAAASARTETQIMQVNEQIALLHPKLDAGRKTLAANKALNHRLDWSVLLSLLAKQLDGDVVLRQCKLEHVTDKGERRYVVTIRGLGRSQPHVSRFVLRLEDLKLFDAVKLIDTSLEPVGQRKAIAFDIQCVLIEAGVGR